MLRSTRKFAGLHSKGKSLGYKREVILVKGGKRGLQKKEEAERFRSCRVRKNKPAKGKKRSYRRQGDRMFQNRRGHEDQQETEANREGHREYGSYSLTYRGWG